MTEQDYSCGTCADPNLVILALGDRWRVQCGKGHVVHPVVGREIWVSVERGRVVLR